MSKSKSESRRVNHVRLIFFGSIAALSFVVGAFIWAQITLNSMSRNADQLVLAISEIDTETKSFVRILRKADGDLKTQSPGRYNQIGIAFRGQIDGTKEKFDGYSQQIKAGNDKFEQMHQFKLLAHKWDYNIRDLKLQHLSGTLKEFQAEMDVFPLWNKRLLLEASEKIFNINDYQLSQDIISVNQLLVQELKTINDASTNLSWIFAFAIGALVFCISVFLFMPMERSLRSAWQGLEKASREAEIADRAKSEFLANMSHEIRTPMNGVMGMAELLQRTELNQKQKAFADIIVKSGASLLTIINDILDFSKIDAGKMELDPAPFNLSEAIEDVATLVSSKVAEKDLELSVRIDPKLPTTFVGDVGRLRQVVTNLVGNAVKFTEQGTVLIDVNGSVENEIGTLKIEVIDSGIGIPDEKLKGIFEKFSQVDESATRKHEGTGLGLAIASSLVRLMGGVMQVSSEAEKGSNFWFEIMLPVHASAARKRSIPTDVSGSRILIVDDNEVNRSILVENMKDWKFESAAASSGHEALAALRAMHQQGIFPDCLILDYHMPELSGADVARAIRKDKDLENLPIIMLTSVDQMEDGKNFSSLGIQGHLVKPARTSTLLETVIKVLQDEKNTVDGNAAGISMARRMPTLTVDSEDVNSKQASTHSMPPIRERDTVVSQPEAVAEKIAETEAMPLAALETPATTEAPLAPVTQEAPSQNSQDYVIDSNKIDILVAEDNEVNQMVISQILQVTGFSYVIAENGKKAVELYKKHSPRLICMDVSMPIMNGHEATIAIRELEDVSGISTPIIGVTAHAIKGDMERCFEAGMDDYLSKPVSPERLEEKINLWMEGKGKSQRYA